MTIAERELIAAYVSTLNECEFCIYIHSAVVSELTGDKGSTICNLNDPTIPGMSSKMKALFKIAARVQKNGGLVSSVDIDEAKNAGANDEDIHDTVFVAAAFCFFNRYVDGLQTTPLD